MFGHDNSSFSSITSDEMRWLEAYNTFLQEPTESVPYSTTAPVDIPRREPSPLPIAVNDSLTILRARGNVPTSRRRHYQTSTKSSNAKAREPLPPSIRSTSVEEVCKMKPSLRTTTHVKRTRKSSGICPAVPSSPSQEWIYRRPRPSPTSSSISVPKLTSTTPPVTPRRATISTIPLQENSELTCPASTSKPPISAQPFWSTLLRSRSRSGSESAVKNEQPTRNISHPCPKTPPSSPNRSPTISHPLPSHVRTTSMSSTVSSLSTATSSSRPHTPTSPILAQSLSRIWANRSSKECSQGPLSSGQESTSTLTANKIPSKSILTRRQAPRKNSLATIASSNKSVKFVEAPTIHYASAVYWDFELAEEDESWGTTVATTHDAPQDLLGPDPFNSTNLNDTDEFDALYIGRCDSPALKMKKAEKNDGEKKAKKPSGLKRTPSASAAHYRPKKVSVSLDEGRPTISGPFALGAQHPPPIHSHLPSLPSLSVHTLSAKGTTGVSLHSAPSLESFQSAKSMRSLRSLRSLSGSISCRAKGLRGWFRDRASSEGVVQ